MNYYHQPYYSPFLLFKVNKSTCIISFLYFTKKIKPAKSNLFNLIIPHHSNTINQNLISFQWIFLENVLLMKEKETNE